MNITKGIISKARNILQYRYDKMQEVLREGVTIENMWERINAPEVAEYYSAKEMYELFVPEIVENIEGKLIYREIKEI